MYLAWQVALPFPPPPQCHDDIIHVCKIEHHLPHGIIECYLPPGECAQLNTSKINQYSFYLP